MQSFMFFIIGIELFLFLIIDIFGHKYLRIKRNTWHKILFISLFILSVLAINKGSTLLLKQNNSEKEAMYLTIRYLQDKDTNNALDIAKRIEYTNVSKYQFIKAITSCMDGDYIAAYFITEQLLDDAALPADIKESIETLNKTLRTTLYINNTPPSNDSENIQIESIIIQFINSERVNLSLKDSKKMDDLYNFDQKIRSKNYGELTEGFVEDLTNLYNKDEEIIKLAITYFMGIKDYKNAYQYAKQLVAVQKSDENYIIFTDIITELSANGYKLVSEDDSEVKKLMDKADKLERKADKYTDNSEKRGKLLLEAQILRDKANSIDIYRAINYLEAKDPLFADKTGLYDLQKAKLYLAINNPDKAKKYINKIIDNNDLISDSSAVKSELEQVIATYKLSTADEVSPLLNSSVNELIHTQSQGVIPVNDNTINGKMANYMTSTLQYDKLGIHISKIDITNYPAIKAYVNISGEKDGFLGFANNFTEKDFEVTDTQYEISDFKVETSSESGKVDIAIVMDCSGSMAGQPLYDAKVAAKSCVNALSNKNQEISIIQYSSDAEIVSERTNSKSILLNSIESITNGGGTNISAGVLAGVHTLTGTTGAKSIILMSDGQDGNTPEEMDAAIMSALKQGVTIYTVGLGNTNDEYLRTIADRTGGKFIKANNSTELGNIYLTLQRYIINNYWFSYNITKNMDIDPRNLTINMIDYQAFAEKKYSISSSNIAQKAKDASMGLSNNTLTIGAVTPNAQSVADITKGSQITITGTSFEDGMHVSVGNLELKDIIITDSTTCTGTLKGAIDAGAYELKITSKDSQTARKQKAVYIYKTGTTKSIKIGTVRITADQIGQTSTRSFVAVGNVLINGFIHSSDSLVITAYDLPDNFDINSSSIPYLGDSGAIAGDGKLYISYAKLSSKGHAFDSFAKLTIGGKDYVVADQKFALGINGSETDIDRSMSNSKISIPLLCTIPLPTVKLYSNKIQIDIDELNPLEIINSIGKEMDDSILSTPDEKDAADQIKKGERRSNAFQFKPLKTSGSVSMALTQDNIEFGFTVGLDVNDSIQFGLFGLDKVELKLNSLDKANEYWKISCDIDFSKIVKGFKGSGISGLKTSISSYYWYFDKMKVSASLNPGIPIYNVLFINELGIGVDGLSNIYRNPSANPDVKASKVKLYGNFSSELNLFKTLDMVFPKKMLDWGVAKLNGTLGVDFSKPQFYANTSFKLLNQEMGTSSIEIGYKYLSMKAANQIEITILDMKMSGRMNWGLTSNLSTYTVSMGVGGSIDWGLMNVHYNGNYQVDITAKADRTYFGIELLYNNLKSKYWYDSNGEPIFWNRFHGETYID